MPKKPDAPKAHGKGVLGALSDVAHNLHIVEDAVQAGETASATPSSTVPVTATASPATMASGQLDPNLLDKLRTDADREATPAYHAFMDKLHSLEKAVTGMSRAQLIQAAIATCGFPKDQILAGVKAREAALTTIAKKFEGEVAAARQNQLAGKEHDIASTTSQIADAEQRRDSQVAALQKQIDELKRSTEDSLAKLRTQKATLETEKAGLEQQINTSVATFGATLTSLRAELSTQTAEYSAALV